LASSTDAFEADPVLTADFGPERVAAIVAVRRGEIAHFAGATPEEITDQLRWVH
jgi:glutamine synthetase